jgi:ribosomal protein S12 methylthiotransferase accessory factor
VFPLSLQSRHKRSADGLEDRTVPLEETLSKYSGFVDNDHGIISALRHYDLPWEEAIHLCRVTLTPSACLAPSRSKHQISGCLLGKGTSRVAAEVSALCEALERFSGIHRGDEERKRAAYSELGDDAIHPSACTLFSEQQYREREKWNRREGKYNWVPEFFDERLPIDWSPVWSLSHHRVKYVPTAYCYFGYPFDSGHDFCRPDSNGNSAGNNLEEAIVHGFLELVERECVALWWYNRVRRPGVDLDSFELDYVRKLQIAYDSFGRSFYVLDVTAARSVPVFAAISQSHDPNRHDHIFGFGAHFDPRLALLRAVTELNQFLPEVVARGYPSCQAPPSNHSFLIPTADLAATRYSDFSYCPTRDLRDDVLGCANLVKQWGLEMLVLDQTRQDVGLPVVKVIVPGMRSWWARFAPGRLYSIPVRLNWLESPLRENELNPDHISL